MMVRLTSETCTPALAASCDLARFSSRRVMANQRSRGMSGALCIAIRQFVLQGLPTTSVRTSLAAAVVSSLAAVIWQHQPALSASAVMDLIYQHSVELGSSAEACLGSSSCPPAKLATFCAVLRGAGIVGGSRDDCASVNGSPVVSPAASAPAAGVKLDTSNLEAIVEVPDCSYQQFHTRACDTEVDYPCPHLQLPAGAAQPWAVGPQPGNDPDPVGFFEIVASEILYVTMESYAEDVIVAVVIVLADAAGAEQAWDITSSGHLPAFQSGEAVEFELVKSPRFLPVSGYVSMTLVTSSGDEYSSQSGLQSR